MLRQTPCHVRNLPWAFMAGLLQSSSQFFEWHHNIIGPFYPENGLELLFWSMFCARIIYTRFQRHLAVIPRALHFQLWPKLNSPIFYSVLHFSLCLVQVSITLTYTGGQVPSLATTSEFSSLKPTANSNQVHCTKFDPVGSLHFVDYNLVQIHTISQSEHC